LRVFIFTFSVVSLLVSAHGASAGPSLTVRDQMASADSAAVVSESTQETEDQLGLDQRKRRDVQRQLKKLGFGTKANGRFDAPTRDAIARWQTARGYPNTGFLSAPQHEALLAESISAAQASLDRPEKSDRPVRHRGGGTRHHHAAGGPVALIGGVVGGLFGRR
jgi:putative peptidoglycan binding protein